MMNKTGYSKELYNGLRIFKEFYQLSNKKVIADNQDEW